MTSFADTGLIGVRLFLDYLTTDERELLSISTEALVVLCEGPSSKGEEIGNMGGIIPLLRLLRYRVAVRITIDRVINMLK